MVQRVTTVAFEGIEVRPVAVQVQVAPGMPAFTIVGLPDRAVSEARERVRSAMIASGLALPTRRITINLARFWASSASTARSHRWRACCLQRSARTPAAKA
jgi:predicted ATPase with chaperone activity